MSSFTKPLITEKHAYHLHFSKVESLSSSKYFIKVAEGPVFHTVFEMKQKPAGNWEVVMPAPDYIFKAEALLSSYILEQQEATIVN
jgi:hypothetical protein